MKPLNADLHCHSTVSDGLLTPAEVVRRAKGNGVELLALTDHDELGGLAEARATADEIDLRFVDGVEISISWGDDQTVHILGYGVDPANAELQASAVRISPVTSSNRDTSRTSSRYSTTGWPRASRVMSNTHGPRWRTRCAG